MPLWAKVVKARYLSTVLNQYSTWIDAPEGLAQSIYGAFGNETDELNQLLHTLWNITETETISILDATNWSDRSKSNESTVLIVASGPSIDDSVDKLKEIVSGSSKPHIFASGSALGTR